MVPSLLTSEDTQKPARAFVSEALGKTVITSQDRAAFVVNALLIPYTLSAVRVFESGFASAVEIDVRMVSGYAHPRAPTSG
jgi:3-hydroxybutyryl-CoA dehydrogenase